jgi:glycosyltransferase involved in cell wall biosynthesis
MTQATIVVPAYNVAATLGETLTALLAQTASDFEIVIVDDGSTDETPRIAEDFAARGPIRIVRQANRGLAGARNTGIAAARGAVIGFCDADDLWEPAKLQTHLDHLAANPQLGVSYSGSRLIDDDGAPLGLSQSPKLTGVTAADILKRNPIGNGSAAVIRRDALRAIAFRPEGETARDWVFDETLRQSEDIECWLRLALTTDWGFEGVPGLLTRYRVNAGGLSAALERQLETWERGIDKLRALNPAFFARHEGAARAYQYRYLARRAVSNGQMHSARALMRKALASSPRPLLEEPAKTLATLTAACLPSAVSTTLIGALRPARSH